MPNITKEARFHHFNKIKLALSLGNNSYLYQFHHTIAHLNFNTADNLEDDLLCISVNLEYFVFPGNKNPIIPFLYSLHTQANLKLNKTMVSLGYTHIENEFYERNIILQMEKTPGYVREYTLNLEVATFKISKQSLDAEILKSQVELVQLKKAPPYIEHMIFEDQVHSDLVDLNTRSKLYNTPFLAHAIEKESLDLKTLTPAGNSKFLKDYIKPLIQHHLDLLSFGFNPSPKYSIQVTTTTTTTPIMVKKKIFTLIYAEVLHKGKMHSIEIDCFRNQGHLQCCNEDGKAIKLTKWAKVNSDFFNLTKLEMKNSLQAILVAGAKIKTFHRVKFDCAIAMSNFARYKNIEIIVGNIALRYKFIKFLRISINQNGRILGYDMNGNTSPLITDKAKELFDQLDAEKLALIFNKNRHFAFNEIDSFMIAKKHEIFQIIFS